MIAAWLWALACGGTAVAPGEVVLVDGVVQAPLPADADLPQGPVSAVDARAWLTVRVAGAETGQTVLGSYARTGDTLEFQPRFSVAPGTRWEATWRPDGGPGQVVALETAGEALPDPPRLLRLEPGVDVVPANLLKLTLTFSAPMQGGLDITEHVHLVDVETGERDARAWYKTELWGPERRRLTLLLHPGRTKNGISFNRDFGPVLEPGRAYRVDVTPGLVDLAGQPLAQAVSWTFTAGPTDNTRPVPEDWVLMAPAGGRSALGLGFDEPMDGWLLETAFVVYDAAGDRVDGAWVPSEDADSVAFTPAKDWAPGAYLLRQIDRVEDRAGNTPARTFDGPADAVKRDGAIQDRWAFTVE